MIDYKKNDAIKPVELSEELITTIINRISIDFNDLDPPIKYKIEVLNLNKNIKYIKVSIYDKEFILSSFFSEYLVLIQQNFLWPKGIYNTVFIYENE